MSVESDIAALLKKAAPLRLLHDDDPAKAPLAGLIEQINAIRAKAEAPKAS